MGLDLIGGDVMTNDFAVDVLFADATSDQLCVLGSEIEDENTLFCD